MIKDFKTYRIIYFNERVIATTGTLVPQNYSKRMNGSLLTFAKSAA